MACAEKTALAKADEANALNARYRREADVANQVSVFLSSLDSFQIMRAEPSDIIADPVGVTPDCDYDCERRGAAGDPKSRQNSDQTKK